MTPSPTDSARSSFKPVCVQLRYTELLVFECTSINLRQMRSTAINTGLFGIQLPGNGVWGLQFPSCGSV